MEEIKIQKKRMLSGIKPSGDLTLGSYLGAVKNWAERADQYECFYFMADLHAITVRQVPAELRQNCFKTAAIHLAAGIDPNKSTLFLQSMEAFLQSSGSGVYGNENGAGRSEESCCAPVCFDKIAGRNGRGNDDTMDTDAGIPSDRCADRRYAERRRDGF